MNTLLVWILVVNGLNVPTVFSPTVDDKNSCEAMQQKLLPAETRARSACVEIITTNSR
jgi:hypothetical protein